MYTEALQEGLLKSDEIALDAAIKSISTHGNNAEHNIFYFLNSREEGTKNSIIDFEEGTILANIETNNNVWNIFPSGIVSNEDKKAQYFQRFCDYCFNEHDANEVYSELDENLYLTIRNNLGQYEISGIHFNYTWPVVDLKNFSESLEGSTYYELRKTKNSFMKNNIIEIKDIKDIPKNQIKSILWEWENNRKGEDVAHSTEYNNWIETDFKGCDYAKCWIVNGEKSAVVAGWKIPNSGSFYLAVVLHNYKVKGLGEMLYLQTLLELKKLGYDKCNLGGSDEKLLKFKKKFLPSHFYSTVEFSVRRKNKDNKK